METSTTVAKRLIELYPRYWILNRLIIWAHEQKDIVYQSFWDAVLRQIDQWLGKCQPEEIDSLVLTHDSTYAVPPLGMDNFQSLIAEENIAQNYFTNLSFKAKDLECEMLTKLQKNGIDIDGFECNYYSSLNTSVAINTMESSHKLYLLDGDFILTLDGIILYYFNDYITMITEGSAHLEELLKSPLL